MSQKKKQIVYAFPMQSGIAAICNVRTVYFNLILYVLQDAHWLQISGRHIAYPSVYPTFGPLIHFS